MGFHLIASVLVGLVVLAGPVQGAEPARPTAFSLIDHSGRAVTDETYRGRYMLVFFGYTFCPDVCPTELSAIAAALDIMGKKADQVTPLFVTVDPERDTTEALAAYVAAFHERMVGLSGSKEQITAAARNYRARYFKVFATPFSDGADDGGDNSNYLVSHSASTYLVGPDGTFLQEFAYGTPPQDMAAGITAHLK